MLTTTNIVVFSISGVLLVGWLVFYFYGKNTVSYLTDLMKRISVEGLIFSWLWDYGNVPLSI